MCRRFFSKGGFGLFVAWILVFSCVQLPAQGLKQVLDAITLPTSDPVAPKKEPSAFEQIAWVEGRILEARERVVLTKSEGFLTKIRSAGFPEDRTREIQRVASQAEDGWISSRNLLDLIVVRETVGLSDRDQPVLPENTTQALALERELIDLKDQVSRFDRDLALQSEVLVPAEREFQAASRDLAKLRNEAAGPLAATLQDRSDVLMVLASGRADSAQAEVFLQKWLGYLLQLDRSLYQGRIDTISKLLDDSGFSRIISLERAALEIARVGKVLPDLETEEDRLATVQAKSAERLAEARSRLSATTADSLTPDLQKQAQIAVEDFMLQNVFLGAARFRAFAARETINLWQFALELFNAPDLEKLERARRELSIMESNARRYVEGAQSSLSQAQADVEKWRQSLRTQDLSGEESARIEERIKKNQEAIEATVVARDDSMSLLALLTRFTLEIDTEIAAISAQRHWRVILGHFWQSIQGVWNFQLSSQGGRELTLGSIVTGLTALAMALILAKIVARRVAGMARNRLHLPGSRTHLFEKLTLYALSVFFVLMALQWLQIPITIFAFLGGALAVGIGFGSQNLINNFISGLLLLLEQKINVGDLVEVDGKFGRVTDLGSRCSSIRKADGVEILVPNSALLEKSVINWTLSDPHHRFDFPVGVAYGSDVELVMRTLQEALDAQPEILRAPASEVAFDNFGDSTLGFHVYYWVIVGSYNTRQIGTQLRVRIDRLFRERGIEMAFPQRVVHFAPKSPIQVLLDKES